MSIEEILKGESKNIEFKEALPSPSSKYTKTIVAFANTQGGKLFVGIADKTRKVVGVDPGTLFQQMDTISNAVSDACVPQIVPEIEPYSIDGRTVIIVTVPPQPNRPYYLKSKGKEEGTYVRVDATSRLASPEKIKELELEGAKISWDEQTCVGFKVTESAVRKLCRAMNRYRRQTDRQNGAARKLPTVTPSNLENWNILKRRKNGYLASNAFVLLTSSHFRYSKTQCAVFAGTERGTFIDRQEYSGPLFEQIEKAFDFVLRNIHLSARIDGLFRRDYYELPPDAIREMIVNAHCHRNYLDDSCVQVALFQDRLEVTSPGGLCFGLTLDEALSGRSRLRNRAVAAAFNQMGLIEAWGNGLKKICQEARAYGLPEPEFIEMPETFRVNLYRKPAAGERPSVEAEAFSNLDISGTAAKTDTNTKTDTKAAIKTDTKIGPGTKNGSTERLLRLIRGNPSITLVEMAERTGLSKSGVRYALGKMREQGLLERVGTRKEGKWTLR